MCRVVEFHDRFVIHWAFLVEILGSLHAAHLIFARRHEQEWCVDLVYPLRKNSCLDRVCLEDTVYSYLVTLLHWVILPVLHPERRVSLETELVSRPDLVEDLGVGLKGVELFCFLLSECDKGSHKSHARLQLWLLSSHHDLNTAP